MHNKYWDNLLTHVNLYNRIPIKQLIALSLLIHDWLLNQLYAIKEYVSFINLYEIQRSQDSNLVHGNREILFAVYGF